MAEENTHNKWLILNNLHTAKNDRKVSTVAFTYFQAVYVEGQAEFFRELWTMLKHFPQSCFYTEVAVPHPEPCELPLDPGVCSRVLADDGREEKHGWLRNTPSSDVTPAGVDLELTAHSCSFCRNTNVVSSSSSLTELSSDN
ncbi:hypothetical protein HPB48_000856 [Haemaphysalis longicornis]|uniref:Uncharacterized protein n=1 Tax=Haemaphysalis longicornis TaxID=44386 RepID=A0A9J6FE20_HAELO|nr:hypothetical protein HPB48_000856 [Haemaphysalis longicornis]